jgi:transposase
MRGSSLGLGCFAHARRKFFDLHQANNSPMAWEALQRIGKLYAIEAQAKEVDIETRKKCARSKAN